jgi:1,4-alpha-glucan branching enzyme
MSANILGNFATSSASVIPAFPQSGKWYEYFTGDSLTVVNPNGPITLLPGEYRIYTTKKLESPRGILGIEDQEPLKGDHLVSVYPNPSSGEFTIELQSPSPATASVSILDLSGRIIRQLKTDLSPEGIQSVRWDGRSGNGSDVPRGMYLVLARIGSRQETAKIIKL